MFASVCGCFLLCPCKRYSSGSEDFLRAGKPLGGGWKAALVSVQGDLDFFAASLQLPRWSLKEGGCPVCKCKSSGPMTWKKFHPGSTLLEWSGNPKNGWIGLGEANAHFFKPLGSLLVQCSWIGYMSNTLAMINIFMHQYSIYFALWYCHQRQ